MRMLFLAMMAAFVGCKFPDLPPIEADAAPDAIDAAPPECTADTATCTGGVSQVCDSTGHRLPDEMCWLGCNATSGRCERMASSNGVDASLDMARTLLAIDIRPAAVVDVAAGTITVNGTPVTVATDLLPAQTGATALRVFYAGSFQIGDVTITGVEQSLGTGN